MHDDIELLKENAAENYFSDTLLKNIIKGSKDRRYSLVKRWLKQGAIIRLKRGIYVLGEKYRNKGQNLFQAAQMLYGPSYISLESALSYHGWIPEAVYTVTSAVEKRAKEIRTPLGVFSFTPVSYNTFFTGVDRVESDNGIFLMASPWRALADYVYVYRKDWKGFNAAAESLRIDREVLGMTNRKLMEEIRDSARNKRVKVFIQTCMEEMKEST